MQFTKLVLVTGPVLKEIFEACLYIKFKLVTRISTVDFSQQVRNV